MARRRRVTSVTDLLSDVADEIKDFVTDELIDRSRDTEGDARRSGREVGRNSARNRPAARSGGADLDELRDAIEALTRKVDGLTKARRSSDVKRPWADYDAQTVADIRQALVGASEARLDEVGAYEVRHKNRQGVLDATVAPVAS